MALYFFHLRDGVDVLLDPEGRELDSVEKVAAAALADARALIADEVRTGHVNLGQIIEVQDPKARSSIRSFSRMRFRLRANECRNATVAE